MSILNLDDEKPQVKAGLAKSRTPRRPKRLGAASLKHPVSSFELERSDLRAHYQTAAARASIVDRAGLAAHRERSSR